MKALVTAAVLLMLPAIALAQPDQTYVAGERGFDRSAVVPVAGPLKNTSHACPGQAPP